MSPYDILMLAVFIGAILFGAWKGLAWQVASLAAIFVSYFVALTFRETLAAQINVEPPLNKFIAMLALFLGTSLVIWMIFGRIRSQIKRMNLGGFDRQAGALVGAFKGALLCMVITLFATTLLGDKVRSSIVSSRSGGYIARGINQLNSVVPDELHAILNPYVEKFNQTYVNQGQGSATQNGGQQMGQQQPGFVGNGTGQQANPNQQVNFRMQNSQQPGTHSNTHYNYGNQAQPNYQPNNQGYPNQNGYPNTNQNGFQNQPGYGQSGYNQYEVQSQINRNSSGQSNQYQGQLQINPNRNSNATQNGLPNNTNYNNAYPNQNYGNPNYQNHGNPNQGNPNQGTNNGFPNYNNRGYQGTTNQGYPNTGNQGFQNQSYPRNQANDNTGSVITQGDNGWPQINVPINTKDIWETTKGAAAEAARRALENATK